MDVINPTQVVEFQVRPVTRYLVTRYEPEGRGSTLVGEFHQSALAEQVGLGLKAVTPHARFYSMVKPEHNRPGVLQALGLHERKSPGDQIVVEGKLASIWAVHEWDNQRVFDVIFSDDTPAARVVDVLPYKCSPDTPLCVGDLSNSPLPGPVDTDLPQYSTSQVSWVKEFRSTIGSYALVDGMRGRVCQIREENPGARIIEVHFDYAQRWPAHVSEMLTGEEAETPKSRA